MVTLAITSGQHKNSITLTLEPVTNEMIVYCFYCKKKVDIPTTKVGFRECCSHCDSDLHVCKNCKYFDINKPNFCCISNTEPVYDREKYNFCEDFSPSEQQQEDNNISSDDVSNKLFGEATEKKESSFTDLFKDDKE
jgi:hypothetical protein